MRHVRTSAIAFPPMPPNTPRTSRLDPVIEILLVALLAFMPAAFGAVEAWSEAVAVALGAAIALCLAIRAITVPAHEVRPSLAWAAVALFILIAAAQLLPLPMSLVRLISPQTAALKVELLGDLPDAADVLAYETLSFYPLGTRDELRIVLLATTVFAAVVTVYRDDRRMRRLLAIVALIGGAFGLLALAQDITGTSRIYWHIPVRGLARSGPFANHSHYGQFMNLSVGCALALLLVRLAEAPRLSLLALARRTAWLAVVIVVGLATVSLSLTRGGIISIVVSGAVATVVLLASRNLRQMAGVVVLLLLGAFAFLFYHNFDRVYARMFEPGAIGARVQMLRDALDMVRMFPTAGIGLGAFEWIFPMFDRSLSASTAEYVENEYVQALVDTGPLGLAAVLLFVAVILARYLRAIRNHDDERIGLAAVGLGYGLVAVMVHSLSDFGQHLPAIACLSAVTCGLLFNLGQRRGARTLRVRRGAGVVALLLVCLTAAWTLTGATRAWVAERRWERVQTLASRMARQDWKGSDAAFAALVAAAADAVAAEPDNADRRYWAAVYRWYWLAREIDQNSGNVPVTAANINGAQRVIGELNEARARAPTFGLIYTILGQIELNVLDRPIGYSHIDAGYRLSRNDAQATFVAGQADARRGRFELARQKFVDAVRLDASTVDQVIDVYLYQVNRPELAADALGKDYFALIRLRDWLRLNDVNEEWKDLAVKAEARAMDVLARRCAGPDAPALYLGILGAYHQENQRYEQAQAYLARALQIDPANVDWRARHAEVLYRLGRTREAIAEARRAVQLDPGHGEAKRVLTLVTGGVPR